MALLVILEIFVSKNFFGSDWLQRFILRCELTLTTVQSALEKALHSSFDERRMNRINCRKEFFRVELTEIEQACKKHQLSEFKLTRLAEAKEYRQTKALEETADKKAA